MRPAASRRTGSSPSSRLLCLIGLDRRRIAQPGLDVGRRAHGGAGPQEGREAGEAEPRLVPQEDQVRLDREAFLHHPAHVVHVPVEGAVGEVEQLDAVEAALGAAGRAAPA